MAREGNAMQGRWRHARLSRRPLSHWWCYDAVFRFQSGVEGLLWECCFAVCGGGWVLVGDVGVDAAAVKEAASQMLCKEGGAMHGCLSSWEEGKAFYSTL